VNSFITRTYYHSCKKGTPAYVLRNAPFKSVIKKKGGDVKVIPFLGEGYYFYEEDFEAAKYWGATHYKDYSTIKILDANISELDLLDINDTKSIRDFDRLRDIYIKKIPKYKSWEINKWIEFFKKLAIKNKDESLFPYNYIRAIQYYKWKHAKNQFGVKENFSQTTKAYYTITKSLRILCVIDKHKINCKEKKVVV